MDTIALGGAVVLVGLVLAVIAVAWVLRSPVLWSQFQDVIAEMNRDNQQLRAELAVNDKAIRELSRELRQAEARIEELEEYAEDAAKHNELLADRLRALGTLDIPRGPQPPPRKDAPRPAAAPAPSLADLVHRFAASFSIEEIDELAMEFGLGEAIAGKSLASRSTSLVEAANRRGLLEELRASARRKRPRGGF